MPTYVNFASERMCINELGDGDPPPTNEGAGRRYI